MKGTMPKTYNAGAAEERGKILRKARKLEATGGTLRHLIEFIQKRVIRNKQRKGGL